MKARFEKVALPDCRVNKAASSWVVYANDKAILRASVDQITKGNFVAYDPATGDELKSPDPLQVLAEMGEPHLLV